MGNELIKLSDGGFLEAVSGMAILIKKLLEDLGAIPVSEVTPDDVNAIGKKLVAASEQVDLTITIGGLSVGEEDYVPQAIESVGQLTVRGVALMPPWLTTFGAVKGKPIVCLPARYVPMVGTFYNFAVPLVAALSGVEAKTLLPAIRAKMMGRLKAHTEMDFFIPVQVKKVEDIFTAKSTFRGPHPVSSLVEANGFIIVQGGKVISEGDEVTVYLFSGVELANLLCV